MQSPRLGEAVGGASSSTRVHGSGREAPRRPSWDAAFAGLAAVLTLIVYRATMYPGLHGHGDAAKFAFVGKVLGTPHEPGYPLYVLVSHAFSYLPWGTVAFRMNLLSAVLASGTVAFVYFILRELGTRPAVAAATTLGLGFGSSFWATSLYAKGYTLHALLVAAGILLLLRWSRTRRRSHFYGAVAVFALSAGNHPTVVALLPALIVYAVITDARWTLRVRTIATVTLIVLAGLGQYAFILVRTLQEAPYLEARAENLSQLWTVMTARRFANEIGAFTGAELLGDRLPAIASLVAREFAPIGVLLLGIGSLVLAKRRPREAVLFTLGALTVAGLTANMNSEEDEGFMLAAFVLLWPMAGVALEQMWRWLDRYGGRIPAVAAVALAALVPAAQVAANYRYNDHHRRTFEIRYFDAMFDAIPDRSAIVWDAYSLNMMVLYKLLGEDIARGRDVRMIARDPDVVSSTARSGYTVYAFPDGVDELGASGFQFEPVALLGPPLHAYLQYVPDGWVVAVAGLPEAGLRLQGRPEAFAKIGASVGQIEPGHSPFGLLGVKGSRSGALAAAAERAIDLSVEPGQPIGGTRRTAPAAIRVFADVGEAWIAVDGTVHVRATSGAVFAVVNPLGGVDGYSLQAFDDLRVPFDMKILPLFRLASAPSAEP